MAKWEYCILRQHTSQEYWIYQSNGEKEQVKGSEVSLAAVLSRLGAQGWEAVSYAFLGKDVFGGSYGVWPASSDGREVFFKRLSE